MVAHAFSPNTQEEEVDGSLSSEPAWITKRVPGRPGHTEKPSLRERKKRKKGGKEGRKKKVQGPEIGESKREKTLRMGQKQRPTQAALE